MNYEVFHGGTAHYVQAGNQYAACLDVLRGEAEQLEMPTEDFVVTPLPGGESEVIPYVLIIGLRLAANGDEFEPPTPEPKKMDLTHW